MAALPSAKIRVYSHRTDHKYLNYLIGSSILSKTAAANQSLFWSNPLVYLWTIGYTLYIAYSHHFITNNTQQQQQLSFLSTFLIKFPLLFAPSLILLVLLNRANRTYFHSILVDTLSRQDLRDPANYYNGRHRSGSQLSSTIWVLDYDGRQLGFVGIDLNLEGYEHLMGEGEERRTILIRHLVSAPDFRTAGIDQELLEHVQRLAFRADSSILRIAIPIRQPIDSSLQEALVNLGFNPLRIAHNLLSPHSPLSSFRNKLLALIGWPDCSQKWPEQIWFLDRQSSQTSKT
ncbi:hypothetical protein MJO28_010868 [Puccinia striiformis f. sp. tritici]|uniref:Uncharacterized protein n=1 Tax=Puccinia striiformis f. sp. tritici TaxID=168172 RepID=A0ACC0E8W4_9BASI|nr:hypothetical protein MJO28_010868 [Puccinia striiformis f. sp. tritici]